MKKYSKKAEEKISEVMEEWKEGKLKSSSGQKVTNRKQAVAIGISEAREEGLKVPPKKEKQNEKVIITLNFYSSSYTNFNLLG